MYDYQNFDDMNGVTFSSLFITLNPIICNCRIYNFANIHFNFSSQMQKLISITLESVTRISVSIFDQSVEGNNVDLQTCMIMVSTNVHAWNF